MNVVVTFLELIPHVHIILCPVMPRVMVNLLLVVWSTDDLTSDLYLSSDITGTSIPSDNINQVIALYI